MPLVVAGMDGARTVVGPGPHFYAVVAGSTGAVVGVEVFCVVVQLHTAGVLDESGLDAFLLRFMPGLTESQPRDTPAAQTTRRAVAVGGANHSFLAFAQGGLTPSGDDVLVGALAALDRGGTQSPRPRRAIQTIADAIEAGRFRTNDISRHYLRLAADGHFGEALTNLIDAAADHGTGRELHNRAQTVLCTGASSGSDALIGALIGLEFQVDGHDDIYPEVSSRRAA